MANSKLQVWAKSIKERDGKCTSCGSLDDLHAHHIKPKSSHPELIYDLSNGIALCYRCHKKLHEENRPPRIRSNSPHKSTLFKRIYYLENEIDRLRTSIKEYENSISYNHQLTQRRQKQKIFTMQEIIRIMSDRLNFFDPYFHTHHELIKLWNRLK